jgi:cytoskeletal protein CcmA (bactofilin family)
MVEKRRTDIVRIIGAGQLDYVHAHEFKCAGSGSVSGNLDADTAKIAGSCKIGGDVNTKIFKVAGSCTIDGNVQTDLFKIAGSCSIRKNIETAEFKTAGTCDVGGSLKANKELSTAGFLKVKSDVFTANFRWSGRINISGSIDAKNVYGTLEGKSTLNILNGEYIDIKARRGILQRLLGLKHNLKVKKIFGTKLNLESVFADYVEGDDVNIGANCHINCVSAKKLHIHKSSKVLHKKQR